MRNRNFERYSPSYGRRYQDQEGSSWDRRDNEMRDDWVSYGRGDSLDSLSRRENFNALSSRDFDSSNDYSGHGPKGYRRSDERIKEDVCEALSSAPNVDASEIEVRVDDGEVILSGTVQARSMKRRAEEAVEHCFGVRDVNNQLRILEGQPRSSSSSQPSSSRSSPSSRTH